jgi:hypothetical protein
VLILDSEAVGASGAGRCGTKMGTPRLSGRNAQRSIGRQCRRKSFSVSETAAKPGQETFRPTALAFAFGSCEEIALLEFAQEI